MSYNMPVLIDLLDQYLFSDAPGLQARAALRRAWELTTHTTWEELYIGSLDDALTEELPHLSAFSGRSTQRPSRPELGAVLAADLGDAGTAVSTLDMGSRAFLTELARAMQGNRLITINRHNLFTDEYRQILLNLFDHAHIHFKSILTRSQTEFTSALATATGNDSILAASISTYLERHFGVKLETPNLSVPAAPTISIPSSDSTPTAPDSLVTESSSSAPQSQTLPETTSLPEPIVPQSVFETTPPSAQAPNESNIEPTANPLPAGPLFQESTLQESVIEPVGDALAPETPAQELVTEPLGDTQPLALASAEMGAEPLAGAVPPEPMISSAANEPSAAPDTPASSTEPAADALPIEPAVIESVLEPMTEPVPQESFTAPLTVELPTEPVARPEPLSAFIETETTPALTESIEGHQPIKETDVSDLDSGPGTLVGEPEQVVVPSPAPRNAPNRLRVLLATPSDVQAERHLLTALVNELDARSRARFGLELVFVNPTPADEMSSGSGQSLVELADIFIGVVWLQFGARAVETDNTDTPFFAGTQNDFARALEQGSARDQGWLRTVIYRSIRPPLDLLHLNIVEYGRVQQFFERAGAYTGDDLVRVYADSAELINDVRARLDAWIFNYAGDLAAALSEYGRNAELNGQPADALTNYRQAIALFRELDLPQQELSLWLQVGALHQRTRDTSASAIAYDTALRLARRMEEDNSASQALHALGNLAASDKNWQAALQNYQQARGYLNETDPAYQEIRTDELVAHESLGDAAQAQGNLANAQTAYHQALEAAQELKSAPHVARLWNKLGTLSIQRKDWQEAISSYDRALEQLDPVQDVETRRALYDAEAQAHAQLAATAVTGGDTAAAKIEYQAALDANAQGSAVRADRIQWYSQLGALATAPTDWQAGIQAYSQALGLLDAPGDIGARRELLTKQAQLYQQIGAARLQAQDWDGANSAYRDALALYQEFDAPALQGAVLFQLGEIESAREHWQEANAYYTEALPRLDVTTNTDLRAGALRAQATALAHIGDTHRDARQWGQAEIAYLQARGNLEQLGAGAETGVLLSRLGNVTAAQSRLPEALAYFQQARARLSLEPAGTDYIESQRAEADTLRRFADMYRGAGDFQSAQAHYRQQLDLAQDLQDSALESDAYHSLGLVAADQSDWDNAIDLYDRASSCLPDSAQAKTLAFIQRHQLAAYEKLGERERAAHHLPQAELAYRSALTLAQTLGEREREADLLYTLGLISIEHENWEDALADLRRALGIYNLMPTAPNKPRVIWNIGRAQRGQKQALLAETLQQAQTTRDATTYTAAQQVARDLGDLRTASIISEQLGTLASERADWDNALAHYDDALQGFSEAEDAEQRTAIQRAQLTARTARSERSREAQQWTNADADLFVALELARTLSDVRAQGDLVYQRGLVAAGQGHWNQAIDLYSDALNHLDESDGLRPIIEHAQADAYQGLGDAEHEAQNWEGAEAAYAQALSLQRNLGNRAPQAHLLAALGDVATRQARWKDAVDQLTHARELAQEVDTPEQLEALDADIELATRALKREQQADAERQGDAKRAAQDYANAEADYIHALAFADELQDRAAQAELNAKLGFVATERGEHAEALTYYRLAAALHDAPELAPQRAALLELQAQTLQDLGNREGEQGNWNGAYQNYSQAIAILDAPGQVDQRNAVVRLQAVTLQNIGDQARVASKWTDALDAYRRAAGLFTLVGATNDTRVVWEREANILTQLAQSAHASRDLERAQDLYALAITRLSDAQAFEPLRRARSEQMLVLRDSADAANAFGLTSADNTARRTYRQALAIAEELDDRPAQAELYQRLGRLTARQQDWQAALLSYQYALDRSDAHSDLQRSILRDQQIAYQQLGTEQRIAGDLAAAESNYNRAYANAQSLDDSAGESELAFLLGMLSADQNAWESALGYYERTLGLLDASAPERADVSSYQAIAYQNLGDAQRESNQPDAAAGSFAAGLKIADELGDDERGAQILYRIGLLDAAQERWEQALDSYARAARRLTDGDSETRAEIDRATEFATQTIRRRELSDHLARATTAHANGAWDDAAADYQAAVSVAQVLKDNESLARAQHSLVELRAEQAQAAHANADWTGANTAYRASLSLAREFHLDRDAAQRESDLMALAAEETHARQMARDWEQAERAAQSQLDLATEFNAPDEQANAFYNLGAIAANQAEWGVAKNYYEQARALLVQSERTHDLVRLDADLAVANDILTRRANLAQALASGDAAAANQDFVQAEAEYRSALETATGLEDDSSAHTARTKLVALAHDRTNYQRAAGNLDLAERAAQEQFAIAREFDDTSAQADALSALGVIAADRENWSESKTYLEQARPLLVAQTRTSDLSTLDATLARVSDVLERKDAQAGAQLAAQDAHARGDYPTAILAYRQAIALANGLHDTAAAQEFGSALVNLTAEQANAAQAAGNWDAARETQHTALAIAQEFDDPNAQANALYNLGTISVAQEQWQIAKIYFDQARPLLVSAGRSDVLATLDTELAHTDDVLARQAQLAQTLADARSAQNAAEYDHAVSAYRNALELARGLGQDSTSREIGAALVATTSAQANALASQPDREAATAAYRNAIAVALEFDDPKAVEARQSDLIAFAAHHAAVLQQDKQWSEAAVAYQQALAFATEFNDRSAVQAQQTNLINLAALQGAELQAQKKWGDAADAYRQALAFAQEFDDGSAIQTQQTNLTNLAAQQGAELEEQKEWSPANDAYRQALAFATTFNDAPAVQTQQTNLINLAALQAAEFHQQHDWAPAGDMYRQALALATGFRDADAITTQQKNLVSLAVEKADALRATRDAEAAERAVQEQFAIAQEFGLLKAQADALYFLGTTSSSRGDLTTARSYLVQAAQTYEQAEATPEIATAYHELNRVERIIDQQARLQTALVNAQTARSAGQLDRAESQYQAALVNELIDAPTQADVHVALAGIAADQERWQDALQEYDLAAAQYDSLEQPDLVAGLASEQARVTRRLWMAERDAARADGDRAFGASEWTQADTAYQKGLELAQQLDDRTSVGEFQLARANIVNAQHDWASAAGLYATAADTLATAGSPDANQARLSQLSALTSLGDESFHHGQWDSARTAYDHAVSLAETLQHHDTLPHIHSQLGYIAAEQNDLPGAVNAFDRALGYVDVGDSNQRSPILEQRALVLERLGDTEMDAGNFPQAETAYEKSLADLRALGAEDKQVQVLHSLGLVLGAQGRWQAARDAHQEAYNLLQAFDAPDARLNTLVALAGAQQQLGQVEDARGNFATAAELAKTLSDTGHTAEIETALGEIAAAQSHWQQALSHYDAARQVAGAQDTTRIRELDAQRANVLVHLGEMLQGEGQWTGASDAYERALQLDAASGRTDRDSILHYSIGLTLAAQSKYPDAIAEYDRAIAVLSDPAELALRDRILAHLATALQQQGKLEADAGKSENARATYLRAIKMAEASDNFDQVADLWFRLGNLYAGQENLADALDASLDAYRRAHHFDRTAGNALLDREITEALARSLLEHGQLAANNSPARAEEHLHRALAFAEQADNPQVLGSTLSALGDTATARGDDETAIDYYARAGHTFASVEDMLRWREVSGQQANLLRRVAGRRLASDEFSDAENFYRRALLLDQAAGATGAADNNAAQTHFGLGRALLAQARYADALVEFEQAGNLFDTDAPERADLNHALADAFEGAAAQAYTQTQWDQAQLAYSRAADYRDQLNQRDRAGLDWSKLAEIAAQRKALQDAVDANDQALARLDSPEMADARRTVLQHQAQILAAIGDQQQADGDWENASATFRRALTIAQEQGDLATLAQLYNLLGSLAAAQEHWDDAATEYHHALDVYQELEQPTASAETWVHLGDMYRQATQYDDATHAFENARDLYRQSDNRLGEGAMLSRLGHVEGDREAWDGAIDQYQAAIHLYNEIDARRMKAEVYRSLERAVRNAKLLEADLAAAQGDSNLDSGDWVQAESAYREAEDLYAEAQEQILHAQMLNQIGVSLEAQSRYQEALTHYSSALEQFRQLGLQEAQVGVLANIGDAQYHHQQLNDAARAYRQALELNSTLNDPARAGELYNALGLANQAQENWAQAVEAYDRAVNAFADAGLEQARDAALVNRDRARASERAQVQAQAKSALERAEASGDLAEAGEILNTLGLMAAEDGEWNAALDYYRRAVTTFERLESQVEMQSVWRTAQGTVLANIGDASQQIGAWHDADYAYTRALGLAREIGDRESEAVLLANLGLTAQEKAELPRALDFNLQALDTYRALGEETPRAELLERVGDLQLKLEQTPAAENTYREALETARMANDGERAARLSSQLGMLAEGRGADDEALAHYQEALARSVELANKEHQKVVLARQGTLYARASMWQDAEQAHTAALSLAIDSNDELLQAELHAKLAQGAAVRGDWSLALEQAITARTLYEKLNAYAEQFALSKQIAQAYIALGEYAAADSALQTAILVGEHLENPDAAMLWADRAALAEKENRWQAAVDLYENALSALGDNASGETRIHLLFRRGDAALRAHAWNIADTSFNDALEVANASNDRVQYGWGMNRLGLLAQAQREWDDALENFQEAIEILRLNLQSLGEARVLNNIAELKLETGNPAEANLFAQAALTTAQALNSDVEASRSLYLRGLVALNAQEFEPARRFFVQAIAASPANSAAQLQLGNTLLAIGSIPEAVQQAEAALGQTPDWELGAQAQLTIASLYQEDTRLFKYNLKRTRALLNAGVTSGQIAPEFTYAVELVVRAMEGSAENALADLNSNQQPALPASLEALQFARAALLALSKSPRRFKGKPALITYFTPQEPPARKGGRRRRDSAGSTPPAPDTSKDSTLDTPPDEPPPAE